MYVPEGHKDVLPELISPMLMPGSSEEARLLVLCLEIGLFPTYHKAGSLRVVNLPPAEE